MQVQYRGARQRLDVVAPSRRRGADLLDRRVDPDEAGRRIAGEEIARRIEGGERMDLAGGKA